jgi:hypothetical protein
MLEKLIKTSMLILMFCVLIYLSMFVSPILNLLGIDNMFLRIICSIGHGAVMGMVMCLLFKAWIGYLVNED